MNKLTLTVIYEIGEYNIPKKIYNLEPTETMRSFRNIILMDLKTSGIQIPPDEEVNYGFTRVDFSNRFVHFLSDHIQASFLATPNGIAQAYIVMFTSRCRLEFPLKISSKDISRINKNKYHIKFIKAIQNENIHKATKILGKGLDPNFVLPKTHECPLFVWCSVKSCVQEALLNMLVQNGMHLDYRSSSGLCAFHLAITSENLNAIKLLYYKGASIEEWDGNGIPALFYALDKDIHTRCLETILELNPNITGHDSSGNNVLHYCCKKGLANHLAIVLRHMTISLSPENYFELISSLNTSGNTPMHVCILQNQKGCLDVMIRAKVSSKITNATHDTPLDLAIRMGDNSIMNMLTLPQDSGTLENGNIEQPDSEIPYSQSLEYCKKYAKTLEKPKSLYSTNPHGDYPVMYKITCNFSSKAEEELALFEGEKVFVYIILRTKIAFGYKIADDKMIYGWFPSTCIGMTLEKKLITFCKTKSTLDNLTTAIPLLFESCSCNFIPVMLFVNLDPAQKSLGLEIACRKPSSSSSGNSIDSIAVAASPFYIRNVVPDSPADRGGVRIGDQVLFIMSNEITTLPMKTVSNIIKAMCQSKIPSHYPKATLRQILFIVLRHNDASAKIEYNLFETQDIVSDFQSICTTNSSNYGTLTSNSLDLNPTYYGVTSMKSSEHSSYGTLKSRHERPLPTIPVIKESASFNKKISIKRCVQEEESTDESIPPPPSELLCDWQLE